MKVIAGILTFIVLIIIYILNIGNGDDFNSGRGRP